MLPARASSVKPIRSLEEARNRFVTSKPQSTKKSFLMNSSSDGSNVVEEYSTLGITNSLKDGTRQRTWPLNNCSLLPPRLLVLTASSVLYWKKYSTVSVGWTERLKTSSSLFSNEPASSSASWNTRLYHGFTVTRPTSGSRGSV